MKGVQLITSTRRLKDHLLFVTDKRDYHAVFNEIIDSLLEFLRQRFSVDDVLISKLTPFVNFDEELVDLRWFMMCLEVI